MTFFSTIVVQKVAILGQNPGGLLGLERVHFMSRFARAPPTL